MPAAPSDTTGAPAAGAVPLANRRACTACRSIKVRCIAQSEPSSTGSDASPNSATSRCRRCERLDLECVVLEHRRGARRTLSDSEKQQDRPSHPQQAQSQHHHHQPYQLSEPRPPPANAYAPYAAYAPQEQYGRPPQHRQDWYRTVQYPPQDPRYDYVDDYPRKRQRRSSDEDYAASASTSYSHRQAQPERSMPSASTWPQLASSAAGRRDLLASHAHAGPSRSPMQQPAMPSVYFGEVLPPIAPREGTWQQRLMPDRRGFSSTPSSAPTPAAALGPLRPPMSDPQALRFPFGQGEPERERDRLSPRRSPRPTPTGAVAYHGPLPPLKADLPPMVPPLRPPLDARAHTALPPLPAPRSPAQKPAAPAPPREGAAPRSSPTVSFPERPPRSPPQTPPSRVPQVCAAVLDADEFDALLKCFFAHLNKTSALVTENAVTEERLRSHASHSLLAAAICATSAKFFLTDKYDALADIAHRGAADLVVAARMVAPTLADVQALALLAFFNRPDDTNGFRLVRFALLLALELELDAVVHKRPEPDMTRQDRLDLAEAQRTFMQLCLLENPMCWQMRAQSLAPITALPPPGAWLEGLGDVATDIDVRTRLSITGQQLTCKVVRAGSSVESMKPEEVDARYIASTAASMREKLEEMERYGDAWREEQDRLLAQGKGMVAASLPTLRFYDIMCRYSGHEAVRALVSRPAFDDDAFADERAAQTELAARTLVEFLEYISDSELLDIENLPYGDWVIVVAASSAASTFVDRFKSYPPDLSRRGIASVRRARLRTAHFLSLKLQRSSSLASFLQRTAARLEAEMDGLPATRPATTSPQPADRGSNSTNQQLRQIESSRMAGTGIARYVSGPALARRRSTV